jgi:hypothetical protein
MKLQGIFIDFTDKKTCGLLPDLCLDFDVRYDELDDNQKLQEYWNKNLEKILNKTKKVVSGIIGNRSIVYSKDKETIEYIKKYFKEIKIDEIEYESIITCDHCLDYDYLNPNFNKK